MATSPYVHQGLGLRWAAEDATAEDFMNVARVHADANRWTLEQLLVDPDTTPFAFKEFDKTAPLTLGAKSLVAFPDNIQTGQNASRIIHVDLDDPLQMWDTEEFFQQIQDTSWHDSLGDPPVHGLMWLNEATTVLVWWDRETDAVYATITGATNGIFDDTTPVLSGLDFKDGKIFASGTGGADATIIDLLRDGATKHSTAGLSVYGGTLGDFTGTAGWVVYNAAAAQSIVNDTVNDIAAVRDPELVDEFGRPKHWWTAGTDGGGSVYSPVDDAIYDSSSSTDVDHQEIDNDGAFFRTDDQAVRDALQGIPSIFTISADAWPGNTFDYKNSQSDAEELAWTNPAVFSAVRVLPGKSLASVGSPMIIFGSDEGLYIAHAHPSDNSGEGALIRLHADYAGPYMKGDIRAAWPGNGLTDVSPAAHLLVNNNTVTFVNGGPAGSYFDFVAASSMSLTLADDADFTFTTAFSAGFWLYRDIDSGSAEGLFAKKDQGDAGDQTFLFQITANDKIDFSTYTAGGDVASTGPAIALATWFYVVGTYDGVTQFIYLNGELVDSDAQTGNMDDSTEDLIIGGRTSGGTPADFFDGRIGGAFVSATVMTQREIRAEYQRGLRRINSTIDTNDTIEATDVDAVAVDPHSKYFAVVSGDKVTIFDELAVPVAIDAAPDGSLRDVAIKSMPGAGDPHYAIGTSTRVELVQPDVRILG